MSELVQALVAMVDQFAGGDFVADFGTWERDVRGTPEAAAWAIDRVAEAARVTRDQIDSYVDWPDPEERQIMAALILCVLQAFIPRPDRSERSLAHSFMSAEEEAAPVLTQYGMASAEPAGIRWTPQGLAFIANLRIPSIQHWKS